MKLCVYTGAVNITTEGGFNLVGPHCPGLVRLFCEATGLSILRWRFNGDENIATFFSDSEITNLKVPYHPAFVLVELTNIVQSSEGTSNNFSSILTVDLSQLEKQNVTNITCGDSINSETIHTNVTIITQFFPDRLNITGHRVTATYDSNGIKKITAVWNKVVSLCCPKNTIEILLFQCLGV